VQRRASERATMTVEAEGRDGRARLCGVVLDVVEAERWRRQPGRVETASWVET